METTNKERRVLCWFSAGAASAVATKLALAQWGPDRCEVWYQDTGSEHPDSARFLRDCRRWFGVPVRVMRSEKYSDIWDVFTRTRYLAGVKGARCTGELKRRVAEKYLRMGDLEVFGFTSEESGRVARFKANNPERRIRIPLVDRSLTKGDCLAILERQGIKLPAMYLLGYRNNNCVGCVKGGMGYWNKIRVDFPETFERMARLERELDAAVCKEFVGEEQERRRVFLDELEPGRGKYEAEPNVQCGILCEAEHITINNAEAAANGDHQ